MFQSVVETYDSPISLVSDSTEKLKQGFDHLCEKNECLIFIITVSA